MSALSVMASFGFKERSAGKPEALRVIYEQPFGKVLLFVMGVAMLGYVVLRFFQAFRDTRRKGSDARGLALRLSFFFIGIFYLSLSYACINLAFYDNGGGSGKQMLIQKAMELPAGRWIVGISGACFMGAGIYQVWRGASKQFMKYVDLNRSDFRKSFQRIGIIGHIARGVVFGIIGYLFVLAAIRSNPRHAQSTDGAVQFVKDSFGNLAMTSIALGLLAYGIFMFIRARYERMNFT